MIYLMSVIVCAFMFAAVFVETNKVALPGHKILETKALVGMVFVTLCPVLNTIVALASIVTFCVLLYAMFRNQS